jgi:hypothetical protein
MGSLEPIELQVSRTPGDLSRVLTFFVALALVVGGIAGAVVEVSLRPLAAAALGVAIYVWLFRTAPQTLYFTYLTLDDRGIEYVHTPGLKGRISRYAWSQIEGVSIKLASHGEEVPGLSIKLANGYLGGVPVLLPVFAELDCVTVYNSMLKRLSRQVPSATAG